MSNKIDGYGPSTPLISGGSRSSATGATTGSGSAPTAPPPAPASSGDTATVSGVAQQLAKLSAAVDQSSGIDSAKVASLQASIAQGTYQPNAQAIAAKLLATQNEGK